MSSKTTRKLALSPIEPEYWLDQTDIVGCNGETTAWINKKIVSPEVVPYFFFLYVWREMSVCSNTAFVTKVGEIVRQSNGIIFYSLIPRRCLIHPSCSRVTGQWTLIRCLKGQRRLRYFVLIVDGNEFVFCLLVVLTIFIIMLFIKCSTGSSACLCVLLQNVPFRVAPRCRCI